MAIKRLLKNTLSNIVFYCYSSKHKNLGRSACRILLYHSIEKSNISGDKMGLAVPVEIFYQQMKYISNNGYKVISLAELVNKINNRLLISEKSIVITFDDGYKGILENALPILKEFGFMATLFVNIYFVEKKIPNNLYWSDWPVLDWKEIKQLNEIGMVIGSHALTHRKLTELSDWEIKEEIESSKKIIEENIQDKICLFCYPHGAFNNKIKFILKDNGFISCCSSIEGLNDINSDIFALRRTEITAFDTNLFRFEKKISGSYDWLRYLRKHD